MVKCVLYCDWTSYRLLHAVAKTCTSDYYSRVNAILHLLLEKDTSNIHRFAVLRSQKFFSLQFCFSSYLDFRPWTLDLGCWTFGINIYIPKSYWITKDVVSHLDFKNFKLRKYTNIQNSLIVVIEKIDSCFAVQGTRKFSSLWTYGLIDL